MHNNFISWSRLCGIIAVAHIILLFCLFFVYKGSTLPISFVINHRLLHDKHARVVIVPGMKHVKQKQVKQKQVKQKTVSTRTSKKSHNKKQIKTQPKIKSKTKPKTQISSSQDKKNIPKKSVVPPKVIPKIADKKIPEEIIEHKQVELPKRAQEIIQEIVQEDQIFTHTVATAVDTQQDIIYLGSDDLVVLRMHQEIEQEITHYWEPPIGLSHELLCVTRIKIDAHGRVSEVIFEKKSGVLAYDISVRTAAHKIVLSQWAYNKELVITFKQ